MIEKAYHYCPRCAGKLIVVEHDGKQMQECDSCHNILYKNQNVTADGIILRDGKLLVVRRAIEPYKGMLDLPGGFVEPDEKPEAAVVREMKEELGVDVKVIKQFGAYGPSVYPYKGVTHYNTGIVYLLSIGNQMPKPADDVASIEWWKLEDLKIDEFAFEAQRDFLRDLVGGKFDFV